MSASLIWLAALALIYVAFWIWYGGNGRPLTSAESESLLSRIEQAYGVTRAEAPEGGILRNLAQMAPRDDGKQFYAINLERLKADHESHAADRRYMRQVLGMLLRRGGHPVFVGMRAGLMLGQYGDAVDRVLVVRYRSLRDLFDMILDPGMRQGRDDKFASLDHTEVFIVRPTVTLVQVRLMVGLVLLLVAWTGVAILGGI